MLLFCAQIILELVLLLEKKLIFYAAAARADALHDACPEWNNWEGSPIITSRCCCISLGRVILVNLGRIILVKAFPED